MMGLGQWWWRRIVIYHSCPLLFPYQSLPRETDFLPSTIYKVGLTYGDNGGNYPSHGLLWYQQQPAILFNLTPTFYDSHTDTCTTSSHKICSPPLSYPLRPKGREKKRKTSSPELKRQLFNFPAEPFRPSSRLQSLQTEVKRVINRVCDLHKMITRSRPSEFY